MTNLVVIGATHGTNLAFQSKLIKQLKKQPRYKSPIFLTHADFTIDQDLNNYAVKKLEPLRDPTVCLLVLGERDIQRSRNSGKLAHDFYLLVDSIITANNKTVVVISGLIPPNIPLLRDESAVCDNKIRKIIKNLPRVTFVKVANSLEFCENYRKPFLTSNQNYDQIVDRLCATLKCVPRVQLDIQIKK